VDSFLKSLDHWNVLSFDKSDVQTYLSEYRGITVNPGTRKEKVLSTQLECYTNISFKLTGFSWMKIPSTIDWGSPTPSIKIESFSKAIKALTMKETNKCMCKVFRGHLSFLFRRKETLFPWGKNFTEFPLPFQ